MSDKFKKAPDSEIIIYRTKDGKDRIDVRLQDETVWLTQELIAQLFQTTPQNITMHIQAIYKENELSEVATCKKYLQVRFEGKRNIQRKLKHYNLDMILAIGYRVRSSRGTQFRQWATIHLKEYLIKGFALDDERLKGKVGVVDYFDELLERIRTIRASEARVYQRIRDIFSLASDYQEEEQETQVFFATMQNKMHYAATGLTAAEIVYNRAKANKANMGLTAWKGKYVLKKDVGTAKNYLDAKEIDTLNRITVMFLDQAEFRAQRRQNIHILDWEKFLDKFLCDTELPVLSHSGSISHESALDRAHKQYDIFIERRRLKTESEAEKRYLDDLRKSVHTLEQKKKRKPASKKTQKTSNRVKQKINKKSVQSSRKKSTIKKRKKSK